MFKKKLNDDKEIEIDEEIDAKTITNDSDTLDDSVIAEENASEIIKKLREKNKKLETEKQDYLTGWQKDKAEFINARKRDEEDRKKFISFANENLIFELIPVLESFDIAIHHNKEEWEKADKNWRTGMEGIFMQLKKALADNGLKEINPIGEKYDHTLHEAISCDQVTDKNQDQMITKVMQKGYSLNGKDIRVPKVIVGEFRP